MTKPRISVVIPTYNEAKIIGRTLRKLNHQTIPREEYEVIVVDGGSTDRTQEIAKELGARIVIQKRKGIGGARNDGFLAAKADFIATTDADCIVPNQWLEIFLEDFRDERVVAVTGPDGPIEESWKSKLTYFILRCFIQGITLFNLYGTAGTNSAFRKSAFIKCGGYKSLPHSDDVEIAFRIKKLGKIVYDLRTFVNLSVRRLEQQGYVNIVSKWLKGDIYILLGKEIKAKEQYEKHSYE
ncbi:MAG TPA: glycosyltransferase [Candidatus Deferrimicrobium sp.]|nr:glycosyltransferase [Candidatus Deferrimicrobium sp.]